MDYESDSIDGVQPRMVEVPAEWLERMEAQLKQAREALEAAQAWHERLPWEDHSPLLAEQIDAALAAMDS